MFWQLAVSLLISFESTDKTLGMQNDGHVSLSLFLSLCKPVLYGCVGRGGARNVWGVLRRLIWVYTLYTDLSLPILSINFDFLLYRICGFIRRNVSLFICLTKKTDWPISSLQTKPNTHANCVDPDEPSH